MIIPSQRINLLRDVTTARLQDFDALGTQSVEYLVDLIDKPTLTVHQRVLYPSLVVRESTAPRG